jgi:hypothetical protein
MRGQRVWTSGVSLVTISAFQIAVGQTPVASQIPSLDSNAWQVAHLMNLDSELQRLAVLRAQRSSDVAPTIEELSIRQQVLETVQVCTLEVDGVVAEITKEQSEISAVRTVLQIVATGR